MFKTLRVFIFSLSLAAAGPSSGATETLAKPTVKIPEITNLDAIVAQLEARTFKGKKFSHHVKLAIFDNGFNGYKDELGKRLPQNVEYHADAASFADTDPTSSYHGLMLALIVAQVLTKSGAGLDYEMHLFNTTGDTKLTDAVHQVIDGDFDLVLYSQVSEDRGNGDGAGYINRLVDQATSRGIVWINAAGNFANRTRISRIIEGPDKWVQFTNNEGVNVNGIKIACRNPNCDLRVVASWDDYQDDPKAGTDKDLDLFLFDSKKNQLESSEKIQSKSPADMQSSKYTMLPREVIETQLKNGMYTARVKIKSDNFTKHDTIRVTATGSGIEVMNPSVGETLLPPADNPSVIAIGASDDINTSHSLLLGVPLIYLQSTVKLKDGSQAYESSLAAAMAAARTVLDIGTGTARTQAAVTEKLKMISQGPPQQPEAPAADADDGKTGPAVSKAVDAQSGTAPSGATACLQPTAIPPYGQSGAVQDFLAQSGAVPVFYNGRVVLVTTYDYARQMGLSPRSAYQTAFITPQGPMILDPRQNFPPGYFEIMKAPAPICQ